jgi:hypothetical protein
VLGETPRVPWNQIETNSEGSLVDKKNAGMVFRFRRSDTVGSADAESDDAFLKECFVDTGDLDALRDFANPKRIIVGRTGSGKTALIRALLTNEEHVVELRPEELALNFLSNSNVLRFFEDAGTNLDVFYQLLWKHVLAVELIRHRFKITNEVNQKSFFERFSDVFQRDRAKEQALKYFREWGNNFWNETESRVREVTTKIENDLRATLEGSVYAAKAELGASEKLSAEERREIVQRGARAVDQVQLSALSNVLRLFQDEIFDDDQEGYFVVIDDLDTRWADDALKFKLIRALIETVRSFRQVRQVKIVVSIRQDLLQRVISATRDSGFQSEKYEPLYLRLRWTEPQLVDLLSRRLNLLVRQRYTTRPVSMHDVFPTKIQKEPFASFLCGRTSLRPREVILFANECLIRAFDKNQVTAQMVLDAEAAYSEKRVDSLQEEWSGVYPNVTDYLKLLSRKPHSFPISELSRAVLEDWTMNIAQRVDMESISDPVVKLAHAFFVEGKGFVFDLQLLLVMSLYAVGAVGLKPDPANPVFWSYYSDHQPSAGSILPSSGIHIHPTFWRALGVR